MLTTSINLAGLTIVIGACLCFCCLRNIWNPAPHLAGKYGVEKPIIQWIGLTVGAVMLCYGAASSVAIFMQ